MLGNNEAFSSKGGQAISNSGGGGAAEDVGIPYRFNNQVKSIPTDFQYLISGRIILVGSSILRIAGQVIIL